MNTIRYTDASFSRRLRAMAAASSLFDPVIEQRTRAIFDDVRARGDAALLELTERFDSARLSVEQLPVTQAEFVTASLKADDSLRAAIPCVCRSPTTVAVLRISRAASSRKGWDYQTGGRDCRNSPERLPRWTSARHPKAGWWPRFIFPGAPHPMTMHRIHLSGSVHENSHADRSS
jgi:hypothetical protein